MHDSTALLPAEQDKLHKCERVILKGIRVFYEVGRALITIRDERLYRALAPTFDEYTKLRFGFTASRARQLIAGAAVVDRVESVTRVTLPSEKIARELNRLPKDQQAGAWQDIVDQAGGAERVTAAKVKQTVDLWIEDNEPYRPDGDGDAGHDVADPQVVDDHPAADLGDAQREDEAHDAAQDDHGAADQHEVDDDRILSKAEAKALIAQKLEEASYINPAALDQVKIARACIDNIIAAMKRSTQGLVSQRESAIRNLRTAKQYVSCSARFFD
jgi:hypothetical protein